MPITRCFVMAFLTLAVGGAFVGCSDSDNKQAAEHSDGVTTATTAPGSSSAFAAGEGQADRLDDPDEKYLFYVYRHLGSDERTRLEAMKRMTDPAAVAAIAKHDESWRVRDAAIRRLTNQTLLTDIAKNDADSFARLAAVEKLTDPAILADLVENSELFPPLRNAAQNKLDELQNRPK